MASPCYIPAMGMEILSGKIEQPARGGAVRKSCFLVAGWTLDGTAPVQGILLTLDGRVVATAAPGCPRPDVARLHPGIPHAAACGWQTTIDLSRAPAGRAVLGLTALTIAGQAIELDAVELDLLAEPADAKRRACAFTIVQNESFFLPRWLEYYGRQFDPSDLYVLDHNTSDGSTGGLDARCRVIRVHRDVSFDHYWLKRTVERFQAFLLNSYETVLFAEADEFVLPNPSRYRGLADYIQKMPASVARCTGFEVVHDPSEPGLRAEEPLLRQRAHWHPSPSYSKPLLARVPLTWAVGFHTLEDLPDPEPDADLVLAHLHRVDFELCRARHEEAARRRWNKFDVDAGMGNQSRIFERAAFEQWFHTDADRENGPRARVPEMYRGLI